MHTGLESSLRQEIMINWRVAKFNINSQTFTVELCLKFCQFGQFQHIYTLFYSRQSTETVCSHRHRPSFCAIFICVLRYIWAANSPNSQCHLNRKRTDLWLQFDIFLFSFVLLSLGEKCSLPTIWLFHGLFFHFFHVMIQFLHFLWLWPTHRNVLSHTAPAFVEYCIGMPHK